MAQETFLTAGTQIDGLLLKRNQIFESAAALLVEAIMDRAEDGKVTKSMEKDVNNLIKGFEPEEQSIILNKAVVLLAMNVKPLKNPGKVKNASLYGSSIFDNRRRS